MEIAPATLVIVLGPPGTSDVLDVDTAEKVLAHIHHHSLAQTTASAVVARGHQVPEQVTGAAPHRRLRFFTADGEALALRVLDDWSTLILESTDEAMTAGALEAEVHAVLETHRAAIEAAWAQASQPAPPIPPTGTWPEQLELLRAAESTLSPPFTNAMARGFWHNLVVHRGNP